MFDVGRSIVGVELYGFVTRMLVSHSILLPESEWSKVLHVTSNEDNSVVTYELKWKGTQAQSYSGHGHFRHCACKCLYFSNNFKQIPLYYFEVSLTSSSSVFSCSKYSDTSANEDNSFWDHIR